ncbi:hypothetical protein ACF0H5_010676 [Mactra antiquata]
MFLTLLGVTLVFDAERIKYNVAYKHKCLASDSLINFLLKISLQQCVRECSLRPNCLSINYRRSKLLCELYSEDDGIFVENNVNTGPCVFVRKTSFELQTPVTCDAESSCARKECPKLKLNKGTILGNLQAVGSRVKFSFDGKCMEANNRKYTTCEENGQWSYVPRCIITSCSLLTADYQSYPNVALGKPVVLSSIFDGFDGHLMVDGNRNQDVYAAGCSHTRHDILTYAIIDLQQTYIIYAMRIFNRQDCCHERLRNVSIMIEDDGIFVENNVRTGPCVFVRKATFEPQTPMTCDADSSCARKECPKLTLNQGTILGNLQAVGSRVKFSCNRKYMEVDNRSYTTCEENGQWSYVPRCITTGCMMLPADYKSYTNVALGKTVNLSSVQAGLDGDLMVDGDQDQNLSEGSCSHTGHEIQNYAIIDLHQTYIIYAIRIFNRQDCCPM